MADLSADSGRPSEPGHDRGQLILVAAFALAVTFVALAIVVNSAIFTENLASRGEVAGTDQALYLRHEVARSVGETIRVANVHNVSALEGAIETGVLDVAHSLERQQAASGAHFDLTFLSWENGSRIAQNSSTPRNFTSNSSAADWTVVENVSRDVGGNGTRDFEFTATKSSLATSDTDAFTIDVEEVGGGPTWQMQLWRDGAGSDTIVTRVETGAGNVRFCNVTVARATFDAHVSRGIVGGEPCYALRRVADPGDTTRTDFRFAAGVTPPYDVSFRNGDSIAGNYSLVTTNTSIGASTNLNTSASRDSPYGTDAAYSVIVRFEYGRPTLTYRTNVRVAPGEPR